MFSGHQPDLVWRGGLLGPQRGNSLTWRAQICHVRPRRIAARRLSQAALSARIAEFGRSGTRFKRAIRGQRLAPDGSTSRVRLQSFNRRSNSTWWTMGRFSGFLPGQVIDYEPTGTRRDNC
jgi:hypothetical protein